MNLQSSSQRFGFRLRVPMQCALHAVPQRLGGLAPHNQGQTIVLQIIQAPHPREPHVNPVGTKPPCSVVVVGDGYRAVCRNHKNLPRMEKLLAALTEDFIAAGEHLRDNHVRNDLLVDGTVHGPAQGAGLEKIKLKTRGG